MKGTRAAARYAKALIDLSTERGELEKVYADMNYVLAVCNASRDFTMLLGSPIVKSDKKISILREIFRSNTTAITLTFMEILARKRRESLLGPIAQEFIAQYKQNKKILTAVITTAEGLDETIRKKVYDLVKKGSAGEVELVEKINKDLIGGFILRIGDKQVDASLLRQLKNLRRSFSENPFVKEY